MKWVFSQHTCGSFRQRKSGCRAHGAKLELGSFLGGAVLWLLAADVVASAETFTVIKSFGVAANVTGCNPACELVQDATGALFGTTGGEGGGTIFKVRPDGSGVQVLKMFTNLLDGTFPLGALVLDGSTLYGVTARGGAGGWGTVFSMGADGAAFRVLKDFSSSDPGTPQAGLAFNGHTLFGVLRSLPSSAGIFRIETDGTDYTLLKKFTPFETYIPRGRLLVSGNTLYGTGSPRVSGGIVFSMSTNGSGYTVIHTFSVLEDPSVGFTQASTYRPSCSLIQKIC